MASGITHILLMKNLPNLLNESKFKTKISSGIHFLQVGAVAPDLPYASIADGDLILSNETELADSFHYKNTNEIPLLAFKELAGKELKPKALKYSFCFFLGYLSHIIADGIIHPFIRDMVGDYDDHKAEHRVLEMKLDVLYYYHLTERTVRPIQLNYANIHEELLNITHSNYKQADIVLELFSKYIKQVYSMECPPAMITGWINGLHTMFAIAEGGHPGFYYSLPVIKDIIFYNYERLLTDYDSLLTLGKSTSDKRPENFLKSDSINYFDDIIPHFYKVFIPIAEKAFQFVFENGAELTADDIAPINLDTGRFIANNDLNEIPKYWS
ncbi:MAG: hypothetical protein A2279_07245 [Stygiobacter sp. RIFOXYA12_FULL_38_9]|nr:MAG: hypothetical protein A2279_07245 [Stygiobacter sp. RIFOXYA12_FULL_38_9]OGV08502.1 MAG: hypothetical protein A2299_00415 [Stygiobacter sp. RIFOXYB2_FULL_37_11]OGV14808.1 MAG: hypothetical protein A2440_09920 [Stygiobacter sp. RIFOXYC2_FULL_38_25]OGV16694.1 MAG: hypothetical protein A2237_11785 [Stygiobacter sp. RIFOXYA2_FULL_38_8]OGV79301.1 MAG: hypothetical protein A2X65_02290 [Stygiobacter sp. GWF2_38_21]RJQ61056.1 MAG: hypothetical protein C4517_09345 [Stygiobacter sp.]